MVQCSPPSSLAAGALALRGSVYPNGPCDETMAVPHAYEGPGSRCLTAGGDSAATGPRRVSAGHSRHWVGALARWSRPAAGAGPRDDFVDAASAAAFYNYNYNIF